MKTWKTLLLSLPLSAALALSACQGDVSQNDELLAQDALFASVPRDDGSATVQSALQTGRGMSQLSDVTPNETFYLAVNKKALGQRYFLSGYLKQLVPGGVQNGAASSFGTRVVSFKVQNGKLFVFDVSHAGATSTTFDPELILEAYPIIKGVARFEGQKKASDYVLVDPSAGLNHFNFVSDGYDNAGAPDNVTVDVSFLQHYRSIKDGVTFEQVFTGLAATPLYDPYGVELNGLRVAGTIGVSLRKYESGVGFTSAPLPTDHNFFFPSEPHVVPNVGTIEQFAARWNIHPGMKPIPWKIAHNLLAVQSEPGFADVDVVGAVKRGIEAWNTAFGFPVIQVEVAAANVSFADDDQNVFIYDEDPSLGYAFANWRNNPLTGEIRGASVYLGRGWLDYINSNYPRASASGPSVLKKALSKKQQKLSWSGLTSTNLCNYPTPKLPRENILLGKLTTLPATDADNKAAFEAYLSEVVTHEVGHTLGLRHNFEGSLVPPSSSVMDYTLASDAIQLNGPQAYDIAAVRYLYGLTTTEPTQPFCSDEETATNPNCATFDHSSDPLALDYGPRYASGFLAAVDGSGSLDYDAWYGLMTFASIGNSTQVQTAWTDIFAPIHAPIPAASLAAHPNLGFYADYLAWQTFGYVLDPAHGNHVASYIAIPELTQNLLNTDGVRTAQTRRLVVQLLKKFQRDSAYSALLTSRTTLQATLAGGTLSPSEALTVTDLIAQITSAVSPYYPGS